MTQQEEVLERQVHRLNEEANAWRQKAFDAKRYEEALKEIDRICADTKNDGKCCNGTIQEIVSKVLKPR